MIRISVIDGAPAQEFTFDEDMISIGRSRRSTLMLSDQTLSRVHCEIASVNGRFLLVNHAKTNGTCVNGQPVGEAFLKPGDTLLVGRVALRFEGGGESCAAEKTGSPSSSSGGRCGSGWTRWCMPSRIRGLAASPLLYFVFGRVFPFVFIRFHSPEVV